MAKQFSREEILKRYYKHTIGYVENQMEEELKNICQHLAEKR